MPRAARPWFRFYVEACSDRKLRRLEPAQRWLWVGVLAVARMSPQPGVLLVAEGQPADEDDLADVAGMAVREVRKAMPLFVQAQMIERRGEAWVVTNWDSRQFESDDVTERTRRHRSKERSNPVRGNAPETETETETEQQQAHTPDERRTRLEAAAALIGQRASQRPGTRDPAATAAAVARAVVKDRHQDAYAHLATHPNATAHELAEHLEPTTAPTVPTANHLNASQNVDDSIADLEPPPPPLIPDHVRQEGLAMVHALRPHHDPEPAA